LDVQPLGLLAALSQDHIGRRLNQIFPLEWKAQLDQCHCIPRALPGCPNYWAWRHNCFHTRSCMHVCFRVATRRFIGSLTCIARLSGFIPSPAPDPGGAPEGTEDDRHRAVTPPLPIPRLLITHSLIFYGCCLPPRYPRCSFAFLKADPTTPRVGGGWGGGPSPASSWAPLSSLFQPPAPPIGRPNKFANFVTDEEFLKIVKVWKHPATEFCNCTVVGNLWTRNRTEMQCSEPNEGRTPPATRGPTVQSRWSQGASRRTHRHVPPGAIAGVSAGVRLQVTDR